MTDRYFENFMRDSIEEISTVDGDNERSMGLDKESQDSLLKLLSMPYPTLSDELKRAALNLKETIVAKTSRSIQDFTVYAGTMGTAFLLLKSFQVTGNKNDLNLCSQIIKNCDSASKHSRDITFLCGRAGVCALGAVVAKNQENTQMLEYYLTQFKWIKVNEDHPDEMLYGRAGYLWACLFLNKNLGDGVIPASYTDEILNKVIKNGRKLGAGKRCPLMFKWYGTRYWGAAHGLAGILYVLMHFELSPDVVEDVKNTLKYMIGNRFASGNYPSCEEDKREDILVHWCHGAPGMALTLVKAAQVFEDKEFVDAAIEAGEVVWKRGLLKRVGICHGISGNAYVFLSLFRLTGNVEMLNRAKAFACFLVDRGANLISQGKMHGGDNRYSLFEGVGGMAYLLMDMIDPGSARFPGYEL
ncbi:hypothetical protein L1887_30248 [Cichorium endivia]|nr:hypothetical protein L1887_30248 [Cichorium endivia]